MPIISISINPFSTVDTVDDDLREEFKRKQVEQKASREGIDLEIFVEDKRQTYRNGKPVLAAVPAEWPLTVLSPSKVIGREAPTTVSAKYYTVVKDLTGKILSEKLFSPELETRIGRQTSELNIRSLHVKGFVTLPQLVNLMSVLKIYPNLKTLTVNLPTNVQYDELSKKMIAESFANSPLTDLIIINEGAAKQSTHFQKSSFDFKADSADMKELEAALKSVKSESRAAPSALEKTDIDEKEKEAKHSKKLKKPKPVMDASEELERPRTPVLNTMADADEKGDDDTITRTGTLVVNRSANVEGSSSEQDRARKGFAATVAAAKALLSRASVPLAAPPGPINTTGMGAGYVSPSPAQAAAKIKEQKHAYRLRKRKGREGEKESVSEIPTKQLRA